MTMGSPSRQRTGRVAMLVLAAVALVAAACGDDGGRAGGPEPAPSGAGAPDAIRCGTQYRPDAESLVSAEEPELLAERVDDIVAQPVRHDFATMIVEVSYQGDAPDGNGVAVVVETSEGEEILRSLYQFSRGDELRTDFAGGHGFTGLNYVGHAGASLQIWCQAV